MASRACQLIHEYNGQNIRPTLRQVHYRLASEQAGGYQNTQACYEGLSKRLVKAKMDYSTSPNPPEKPRASLFTQKKIQNTP